MGSGFGTRPTEESTSRILDQLIPHLPLSPRSSHNQPNPPSVPFETIPDVIFFAPNQSLLSFSLPELLSAAASLCVLDSTRRPFTNELEALCSIPDRFFGASLTARVSGAIQSLSNFPSFLPSGIYSICLV
ncbi:hypothetical protein CMV_013458 [Castanea mollissima]|uniref:Uncharacterized protein n=1 Tax=Castanea mollissima TaxID=60419 RepID=A0A8J4QZE0_9ROSI|nr:hypothetical protein CMV_013458 [Castanea mollissima]